MTGWKLPECRDEELLPMPHFPARLVEIDRSTPPTELAGFVGATAGSNAPSAPPWDTPTLDGLWRCRTRQNLTGASLPQIRRGLACAWRLMLAQQIDEALCMIDGIERQLDDIPSDVAKRLHSATQLVRAVGLAFQDDSPAALEHALSIASEGGASQDNHVISTLCRLAYWQLGKLKAFHALPRHQPRAQGSRSHALSAMVDLSIEAAVALDQLQISTAKRLASDAMAIAAAAKAPPGLAAIPACLVAQLLYEGGHLDEASTIVRDRLPAINAEGPFECALRAYLVLTRVARLRGQYDRAAILLREAEVLGERRGWPRLVAACVRERISLLLDAGRTPEARLYVEYFDRHADARGTATGQARAESMRYATLAHCRVSWTEAPSREAVAAFRRLYHRTIDRGGLYAGCRLAIELAGMLASIGETEEADALFFRIITLGATAGLHQIFLERGEETGLLLRRAYERADVPGSADRELRPLIGSLLSRWDDRHAKGRPARSGDAISDTLTARERDLLHWISRGMPNKQIARVLEISPETVKSHMKRIFMKLAVGTRAEAVSQATSLGLL
jgi:ATP/maltotriose-dependent transcriptional regulator MalT